MSRKHHAHGEAGRSFIPRQRRRLSRNDPRARLQGTRGQTPPHAALPAPHQRQSQHFIRTLFAGWAYGAIYRTSNERRDALPGWLDFYNRRRPHRSLGRQAPLERLHALNRNNVLGSYT